MTNREMLILERMLVEKIDENRGDLSRTEFIDFCIDSCLEIEEPEREEKPAAKQEFISRGKEEPFYPTRVEFHEFKHSIRELLRAFLDFFITFGLELGTSRSAKGLEDLKSQLRSALED